MKKPMPQISLDFGPEHTTPSPGEEKEKDGSTDDLARQYMSAGVGVRIKSMKNAKTAVNGDLPVNGELFGGGAGADTTGSAGSTSAGSAGEAGSETMPEGAPPGGGDLAFDESEEAPTVEIRELLVTDGGRGEAPPTRTYRKKEPVVAAVGEATAASGQERVIAGGEIDPKGVETGAKSPKSKRGRK
ncbi:MAG TPA: hypothetical protein VNU72_00190, partial [Puia sp.]|nr:hypothetical protein [Puia sp.]